MSISPRNAESDPVDGESSLLTRYLDLEQLERLLQVFSESTGVSSSVIDPHGIWLARAGWQSLCTDFHRQNEESRRQCIRSEKSIASKTRESPGPVVYRCPHGLTNAVAPITVEGHHLADAFVGQFLLEEPDVEEWRRRAARWGFDEAEYLEAVAQVPVLSEKKVRFALTFLQSLTELLAGTGQAALIQQQTEDELRVSEARYRSLFADSPVAMWEEDHSGVKVFLDELVASGIEDVGDYLLNHPDDYERCYRSVRILGVNEAAARLYDAADPSDLIARCTEIDLRDSTKNLRHFWAAMAHNELSASFEESVRTLSGRPVDVYETCLAAPGHETAFDRVILADIDLTERKQAEARLAHVNRLLSTVSDINQIIVREQSVDALLSEACRILVETGGFTVAWIGACAQKDKRVVPVAAAGTDLDSLGDISVRYDDSPEGRGPSGTAIRSGRVVFCEDLETDPMIAPWRAEARKRGCRSSVTTPLRVAGQIWGTLSVYATEPKAITEEMEPLLEELADDLGYALQALEDAAARAESEAALRASKERYRMLAESTPDFIYAMDRDERYTAVNGAYCRAQGMTAEQMIGTDNAELGYPPELVAEWQALHRRVLDHGEDVEAETTTPMPDGNTRTYEIVLSPVRDEDGTVVGIRGRNHDITARRRAEGRLRLDAAVFENLAEGLFLIGVDDRLIKWVNAAFERMFGYQAGEIVGKTVGILGAPTDKTPEQIEAIIVGSLQRTGEWHGEIENIKKDGTRFWCFVNVSSAQQHPEFGEVYVAAQTDITERKRAERAEQRSRVRLERTLESAVKTLARTIELRDPYTAGHQERVTELALAIGERLKLAKRQLTSLRISSLIHDLGKIAVPAEILAKPGTLSEIEWKLIRRHPETAYEILRKMRFPGPVATIVRQHHERLDGSGYPQGLVGDKIRLETRILTVADVVEAIASHRPYRAALGIEVALEFVRENKGTLFDADVVDACVVLFGEGFAFSESQRGG